MAKIWLINLLSKRWITDGLSAGLSKFHGLLKQRFRMTADGRFCRLESFRDIRRNVVIFNGLIFSEVFCDGWALDRYGKYYGGYFTLRYWLSRIYKNVVLIINKL